MNLNLTDSADYELVVTSIKLMHKMKLSNAEFARSQNDYSKEKQHRQEARRCERLLVHELGVIP